jgi:hypothetical protein
MVGSGSGMSRRSVLFGGGAALAVAMLGRTGALAQEGTPEPEEGPATDRKALRERLEEYGFLWSATSPATHLGDVYTLTAANTGTAPVKVWVFAIVMDHRQHHNEVVVREEFELAPGESREVTATNEYGTANHFSTRIVTDAADASDLELQVTVVDGNGQETTAFNQLAFMIESREELQARREARQAARRELRRRRRRHGGHEGHEGMDDDGEGTPEA